MAFSKEYKRGVMAAVFVAADYDKTNEHTHRVSDCILAKLDLTNKKPRPNKKRERWFFLDGFALALAEVNRKRDIPSVVVEVVREAGVTVEELRRANVAEYDVREIARCLGRKK